MNYVKPSTAIARVLRSLGLKQGADFRVQGKYQGRGTDRERVGTHVDIRSSAADQIVADNADRIEQLSAEAGNSFRVSVHFTAGGHMWTWVANYGQRTRETPPVAMVDGPAAQPGGPSLGTEAAQTASDSHKLTATQRRALAAIRSKGVMYAYNGVSRATVEVLQRKGLIDVKWTTTYVRVPHGRYGLGTTYPQLDWTARPVG